MADELLSAVKDHLATLAVLSGAAVSTAYFPTVPTDGTLCVNAFVGAVRERDGADDRELTALERDITVVVIQNLGETPSAVSDRAALENAYGAAQAAAFAVFRSFRRLSLGPWLCAQRSFPTPGDFDKRDSGVFRAEMTLTFLAADDGEPEPEEEENP